LRERQIDKDGDLWARIEGQDLRREEGMESREDDSKGDELRVFRTPGGSTRETEKEIK
jgi:hypothetical protein